jgi:hypothetical protein
VAKGLLFYYFPRKMDLLRALFAERRPTQSLSSLTGIAVQGDVAGSLVRLADRIGLTGQHWQVLSAIAFREASTHPDVRDHLRNLYSTLMELPRRFWTPPARGSWTMAVGRPRPAPSWP